MFINSVRFFNEFIIRARLRKTLIHLKQVLRSESLSRSISLFEIYSDEDDIRAVNNVLKRGKQWAEGPEIREFEKNLAEYVGRKYALTFNSGTSALHTALISNGIGEGDEVIVPSFTFISTANTVLLTGAKPIFAEVETKSYGLDSESVAQKLTEKTKAIIPVHVAGAPCKEISELCELAKKKNILIIEDAAEALGSRLKGQMIGTFGDSAMYSFCQNKVITTGEGGAIVTDSEPIYEKMRLIRSHGRQEKNQNYFNTTQPLKYIQIGYNYRMPTISAALGIAQLNKIEFLIEKRQEIAKRLTGNLRNIKELKTPEILNEVKHIFQMYTIELNPKKREALQQHLLKKGIMTKIYFPPIHLEPFYRQIYKFKEGLLPKTEELSKKVLTLPMHPKLSSEDIDYITESIREFLG